MIENINIVDMLENVGNHYIFCTKLTGKVSTVQASHDLKELLHRNKLDRALTIYYEGTMIAHVYITNNYYAKNLKFRISTEYNIKEDLRSFLEIELGY